MPGRLLTACAAAALALMATGSAAAKLVVSTTGSGTDSSAPLAIEFQDASPAALTLYVPPGVEATLGQAPGTELGSGKGSVRAGGADAEAAGTLLAADPASSACAPAGHDAVWRVQGPSASLELAVDRIAPGAPEASFASYRIAPCGDALVRSLELRLQGAFRYPPAAGAYVWRAIATPVDASGAPIAASATEHRSTELVPARVSLRASLDRAAGRARLSGTVSAGGRPLAGVRVALAAGASASSLVAAGHATTGARGRFELQRPVTRATTFRASVDTPARADPAGCADPLAPGGCVSATLAPISATSEPVRVRVPALRVLRLGARGADVALLRRELARLRYLPSGGGSVFDERTWHAVVALQGWRGLPRTGVVDRRTWKALRTAQVPAPWARIRRGVLIDTARQVLLLVDGGRTVRAIHVSTGAYGRTPRGRYSVYRKEILSWSVPFSVWMPYASYFVGGFAMHAYSSVPAYPASHGCVRIPPPEAPGVYRFAGYGTPVIIR